MLEIILSPPKDFVKKNLSKKISPKKVWSPATLVPKTFGLKKMLIEKSLSKYSFTKLVNKSKKKCWLDFIKSMNKNKLKLGWEKPYNEGQV